MSLTLKQADMIHPPPHVVFALRYNWKPRHSRLQTTLQSHIIRELEPVEPPRGPIDITTASLMFYLPATYRRSPLGFHLRPIKEVLLESFKNWSHWAGAPFFLPLQTQMFELMNCFLSVTDSGWHVSPRGGMFCVVFFSLFSYYLQRCLYAFIANLHICPSSSLQVWKGKTSCYLLATFVIMRSRPLNRIWITVCD